MRLAYLVPKFPCLSETFVAGEFLRIRRSGIDAIAYGCERPDSEDAANLSPEVAALIDDTTYMNRMSSAVAALFQPKNVLKLSAGNRELQNKATAKSNAGLRLARAVAIGNDLKRQGVTHLHAHWPYATQLAWLVNKLTGIPYSVSIHAHEVEHENGHFPEVFKSLSFATFCNRGAMDRLLSQLPAAAADRSHLVYHGVDISRFEPVPVPSIEGEPFRVVSAGRLTKTKGFDRLISACAELVRRGVDVQLTVLGRGAEESALRAHAASLRFTGRLDMPGWVSHDEVRRRLVDAHVFALLANTNFHDGLPNVVLEAMAVGRPIVLSALPAAGEAVDDGIEGRIVVNHNDPGIAADALQSAAAPGAAEQMGASARERVVRDHDADVQIMKLVDLFQVPQARAAA